MAVIKQIQVDGVNNDIDAKYWEGHRFSEIKNIAMSMSWSKEQYQSSSAPSTEDLAKIPGGVIVHYNNGSLQATGTLTVGDTNLIYLIYSPFEGGGSDNYVEYIYVGSGWEIIGHTGDIDLSNYVQKGTYTTNANSVPTQTGSAGEQTATGSVSVSYKKADSETGTEAAHTHTVNVSSATLNYISGLGATPCSSNGDHSHTVASHEHGANVSVVGFTAAVTGLMGAPTVSQDGVLSWTLYSANKSVSAAGAPSAATLTTSTVGAHTHTIGLSSASITYVTGATVSPAGSHSHTIGNSDASATGSVSVPISAHTHSIATHTHSITL